MRKQLLAISVSAALLLAACSGGGSSSPSGDTVMSGNVVNGPLAGATVEFFNPGGEEVGRTSTDNDGFYEHRGLPHSANGYRVEASNGYLNGLPYPGVLIAHCNDSPCWVTPLSTAADRLAGREQIGYADAHQRLFNWLGLEKDPFIADFQGEAVSGVDLDTIRAEILGDPEGVTGWVAKLAEKAVEGSDPPQSWRTTPVLERCPSSGCIEVSLPFKHEMNASLNALPVPEWYTIAEFSLGSRAAFVISNINAAVVSGNAAEARIFGLTEGTIPAGEQQEFELQFIHSTTSSTMEFSFDIDVIEGTPNTFFSTVNVITN